MPTRREALAASLLEKAATSESKTWLIVLPASGTVRRVTGALLLAEVAGREWMPFIVSEGTPTGVDSRSLIVEDSTLAVGYQPRLNLKRISRHAVKWFRRNPDVFDPKTPSGVSAIYE
jgi:hypothetical protein